MLLINMFILALLVIWAISFGGWYLVTKFLRPEDPANGNGPSQPGSRARDLALRPRLELLLEQAGVGWDLRRLILFCFAALLVVYLLAIWGFPAIDRQLAFLAALLAAALPLQYVIARRSVRLGELQEQIPQGLTAMASSLRAGEDVSAALQTARLQLREPLAGEFGRTLAEFRSGITLPAALHHFGKRVPSLEAQIFVSVVAASCGTPGPGSDVGTAHTGGLLNSGQFIVPGRLAARSDSPEEQDLASILERLAAAIREHRMLRAFPLGLKPTLKLGWPALLVVAGIVGWWFLGSWHFPGDVALGEYMLGAAILIQLTGFAILQKLMSIEI